MTLDIEVIRAKFPILSQKGPQGQPLIYLDNAATTQKPQEVIDAITHYYAGYNANVGRGAYWPATQATTAFNAVRKQVQGFINATSTKEVIYTAGTTDAINKLCRSFLEPQLSVSDEVIVTEMEHHGNFVPWQQACQAKGATLKVVPLTDSGEMDMEAFKTMLSAKVKLVAVTAVSNALGTRNDLEQIVSLSHEQGAVVLIDAAQQVLHESIDVQALDCDFLTFSAHKLFGPTGIGILYGKEKLLESIPPFSYGGGMVKSVTKTATQFADLPNKHEAGTAHIAGVMGMGAAIGFVQKLGIDTIHEHTRKLTLYAIDKLRAVEGLTLYGTPENGASLISFNVEGVHPHDVASFLSEKGIGIRAGHHCTHPLMQYLQVHGTCRVSFGIYNQQEEVDLLVETLVEVRDFFR